MKTLLEYLVESKIDKEKSTSMTPEIKYDGTANLKELFKPGDKCIILNHASKNRRDFLLLRFAHITKVLKTKITFDEIIQDYNNEEWTKHTRQEMKLNGKTCGLPCTSNYSSSVTVLPVFLSNKVADLIEKNEKIGPNYYWADSQKWSQDTSEKYKCELYMRNPDKKHNSNDSEYKKMDIKFAKELLTKYFY